MKSTCLFLGLTIFLSACDLGPLARPTPTPLPTATSTPTLAPTSTDTPTATSTATSFPTQTFTPTAVTCPKGTLLQPSVNKCFYASRTPKPELSYCQHFKYKWACINNGCFWDRTVQLCK
jgi:hypothetical protein